VHDALPRDAVPVVAFAAAGLAGCGGDDDEPAGLSKEEFVAKADAIRTAIDQTLSNFDRALAAIEKRIASVRAGRKDRSVRIPPPPLSTRPA